MSLWILEKNTKEYKKGNVIKMYCVVEVKIKIYSNDMI